MICDSLFETKCMISVCNNSIMNLGVYYGRYNL